MLHADRGTQNMKQFKQDFRSKAWIPPQPLVGLMGWGQNVKVQNMAILHIKLKGITNTATW